MRAAGSQRIGRPVPRWLSRSAFLTMALSTAPPVAAQSIGWTRIDAGRGTGCAHDSPFAFFVHLGHPRRLMLYFQGGGACWNGTNCDLQGRPTFDPQVDSTDDPARALGILDLANPANPIRDYSIVFIPYCTADLHLGARVRPYADTVRGDRRTYRIRHNGSANASGALAWVYGHFDRLEVAFVAGGSAGAIPSPVFAAQFARHYPWARVVQLGDGGGGYRAPAIPAILARWGATEVLRRQPAYRSVDPAALTFESFYVLAARDAPSVRFAQYNNAQDKTQLFFLEQLGLRNASLPGLLALNLAEIRRANPRFRSYTAPGQAHTILLTPQFYALTVDGVAIRDWVAALLGGQAVRNVGDSLLWRSR